MKLAMIICLGAIALACGTANAQSKDDASAIVAPVEPNTNWDRNFTLNDSQPIELAGPLKIQEKAQAFQFGGAGRWQMNVDVVSRPVESPLPREEMRAGATYQFTPRFSLGGSFSVGANELDDVSQWEEQKVEAGVRLKTTFKF